MDLSELQPNPRNPRKITDPKLKMLKESMEYFGDLSGIIFNRRFNRLSGGHQRIKVLPQDAEITIERHYEAPTKTGTVAEGFVSIEGERFNYREVDWDENKEKAANLAANKHGGEWDMELLPEFLLELDAENFNLDLTGFEPVEIEDILAPVRNEAEQNDGEGQADPDERIPLEAMAVPEIRQGDCIEVMQTLQANSIDALVTDPPAGISFMGKDWDADKGGRDKWIAWMESVMRESLRVMKPGAHGLVWALPRTSHWTATALEDAGFEVRDVICHLFGSGFPKSLAVDKAIDKMNGDERPVHGTYQGATNIGKNKPGYGLEGKSTAGFDRTVQITSAASAASAAWEGWGTALKPASEHWILVRKKAENDKNQQCEELALSVVPSTQLTQLGLKKAQDLLALTVADLSGPQKQKEKVLHVGRAVNGLDTTAMLLLAQLVESIDLSIVSSWKNISDADLEKVKTFITLTATRQTTGSRILNFSQLANMPEGIRPKSEHVILIRKPLEGTVAENVLKWGVGAINIDGCRIGPPQNARTKYASNADAKHTMGAFEKWDGEYRDESRGRFPANLVLSHSPDCELSPYVTPDGETHSQCADDCPVAELDRQSGQSKSPEKCKQGGKTFASESDRGGTTFDCYGDSGGASRFFYVAKPAKRERNAGLEGMPEKVRDDDGRKVGTSWERVDGLVSQPLANFHPTVKPLKLMRYLVKLITPLGGLVLDPFCGSGTTGVAAAQTGMKFLGIEKDPEYYAIATHRFAHELDREDDLESEDDLETEETDGETQEGN